MRAVCFGAALQTAALAVALAGPAGAEDSARIRADLRELEHGLAAAAARVSRANAQHFLAFASACRGYYLKDYGFVLVLPPRDLPRPPGLVVRRRFFAGPGHRRPDQEGTQVAVGRPNLPPNPELAEFERHVAEMQLEADLEQAEAERMLEDFTRRLAPPPPAVSGTAVREAPPPPQAPSPPPATPAPAPFRAPWRYWVVEEQDGRLPDQVVADVRDALTAALAEATARLTSLQPDEIVAVTVDFVAGTPFIEDRPPARSLVVRVKKRDLQQRQEGRLSTEEFRQRIETLEY